MKHTFHALPPLLKEMTAMRNEHAWLIVIQGLFVGAGAGAVISIFRRLYDYFILKITTQGQIEITSFFDGVVLFFTLGATALIVGALLRYEPLISGSGIPHVELVLNDKAPLPWFKVVTTKFIGTLLSLSGGLSVGREGPSIQMGAAVGRGFGSLFQHLTGTRRQELPRFVIAGSVAGMTAAFGAPIAGIFFAFEELRTLITVPLLLFTTAAAAAAWFMVTFIFGLGLVFPFSTIASLPWSELWLTLPIGIFFGVFGAFYNLALVKTTLLCDRQKFLPSIFKPLLPFFISGMLFFLYPQVLIGFGYSMTDLSGLNGTTITGCSLVLLLTVKILFSIISFASGVPGGLLMPMLFIGGISGSLLGALFIDYRPASDLPIFLVLGMTGLFSATVRAPLTGTTLVAEMCGTFHCLPEMLLISFIANFTANRLGSTPIYRTLKVRMHRNIRRSKKK